MNDQRISEALLSLYREAPVQTINDTDKFVIFSDLHLGNGSSNDDFAGNSELFDTILRRRYLPEGYTLVLNGDIEELQKFRFASIYAQWKNLYTLFAEFKQRAGLIKIIGNHDAELALEKQIWESDDLFRSYCLRYENHDILLFHGHQASKYFQRYNKLAGWLLRYIVRPLRIKNFSVSHDSRKQYKTERRVYHFSRSHKLLSVIGHTHRPLLESLSKADSLKYKIEHYLRKYSGRSTPEREKIAAEIRRCRQELRSVYNSHPEFGLRSSLYNREIIVPSLFNSGCGIGKRGITGIEISGGTIALVHFFDKNRSSKYFNYNGLQPEQLGNTGYYRMVVKKDSLEYIFARIELLT